MKRQSKKEIMLVANEDAQINLAAGHKNASQESKTKMIVPDYINQSSSKPENPCPCISIINPDNIEEEQAGDADEQLHSKSVPLQEINDHRGIEINSNLISNMCDNHMNGMAKARIDFQDEYTVKIENDAMSEVTEVFDHITVFNTNPVCIDAASNTLLQVDQLNKSSSSNPELIRIVDNYGKVNLRKEKPKKN